MGGKMNAVPFLDISLNCPSVKCVSVCTRNGNGVPFPSGTSPSLGLHKVNGDQEKMKIKKLILIFWGKILILQRLWNSAARSSSSAHLERVPVVLAALRAAEPGEVVVDPRLRGTRDVRHVRLQRPQLDLRLQRVRVAPARTADPVLENRAKEV